jgi:5-methylthioadenosine/S-adenosylhomocysteine deaminase
LEGPVLAAHGVWLDETDRRLLAAAGASVAHCPQSNLKLGSGIAAVPDLLRDGVNVSVGTDGPASNDDLDLWEEVRLAALLARGTTHDPEAMSAVRALDLATRCAASALRLPDVGELRPGSWADLLRIELDVPAFSPHHLDTLLTQLVFAGSARYVSDVWVAGRQVVADHEVTTVDVSRLIAACAERAERLRAG